MMHTEVYKHFINLFPEQNNKSAEYFSNGKNSIRIRDGNKNEIIFTFNSLANWKLETVNSYLNSKKES